MGARARVNKAFMLIVRLEKVCLSFGLRPLLDHIDLQISSGERVCLLGRNGEGKSSLLKLIAREVAPDTGEVWIRPGARTAILAQEVSAPTDASVRSVVRQGACAAKPGATAASQDASMDGADADWQADLRVDQIISRLELDADAPMSALSGGWRRRVMLGRALVAAPDVLLLDEPTNHLDIEAISWLEEMMIEFGGALLFVSHDRAFLRRLATRVLDLDRGRLRGWSGSYDDYVLEKRAALDVEAKHAALFDKKLAQEEAWIRQGIEARRTRNEGRVRALKQLRLERSARRERAGQVDLKAQQAAPSGKLVFEARHVTFDFGAAPVIEDFSARIMRGDRIGIVGPNGCGKTTLIKLLVGDLEPTQGSIYRGTSLKPAYFDQQREALDESASIMDNVAAGSGEMLMIDGRARHASGYLRDFLFPPERLHAPVRMLSGGERNRLLLAKLFAKPSNLLIMDEPTNDLDAETLDLMEELVADYAGTLLLVSHDRAFLDNVVTSTLVFEGHGRIEEYVGGYSDSVRQRQARAHFGSAARAAPTATSKSMAAKPAVAQAGTALRPRSRRRSYKEQRELDALPAAIQQLESEQSALQTALSDPALFRERRAEARDSMERLRTLAAELDAAYARWDALEALE
jgi:ATP-binding cassette subfamily F protein uup